MVFNVSISLQVTFHEKGMNPYLFDSTMRKKAVHIRSFILDKAKGLRERKL